jgi:streptogrisin C
MVLRRGAIAACMAFAAGTAGAQAPAPKVPDKAADEPPHIQTQVEALMQDGADYARLYGVPLGQAMRELEAEQDSVPATEGLAAEFRDRLAGISIAHEGGFRIVVLLTGDETVAPRSIVAGGLEVPVVFQTGAPATRDGILAAIRAHQGTSAGHCVARQGWESIRARASWW